MARQRICLIPLDARPVCYEFPKQLIESAGLDAALPSANILGQLKQPANRVALDRWLKHTLSEHDPKRDALIVALDTIAYGGLIPSRVGDEPLAEVEQRLNQFLAMSHAAQCYGFASILRIPDGDSTDEEPEYWAQYGKQLYRYSIFKHQARSKFKPQSGAEQIPESILNDFLNRRARNYAVNHALIEHLKQNRLASLTFCQDDTGPYGLNVQEAGLLARKLQKLNLADRGHVQTGADEVAHCMIARWLSAQAVQAGEAPPKVWVQYSHEAGELLTARFDGIAIGEIVAQRVAASGAQLATSADDADLWLAVHTPAQQQGDHCSRIQAETEPAQMTMMLNLIARAKELHKPLTIADVAYANGSDPDLAVQLVSRFEFLGDLYGYAGWNTPGNAIGSAVAMAVIRLLAERRGTFCAERFQEALVVRFADDWLYQADIRQALRNQGHNGRQQDSETLLNTLMADGLSLLRQRFDIPVTESIVCRFPCQRTFEVELALRC
ncbi:MAG: DUF4127 family protein [Vampirovibrionales bacterium]|nr:DUF4127 family protein [Vampirovibrionales bacterium]